MFPMQGMRIQSLVQELRFPHVTRHSFLTHQKINQAKIFFKLLVILYHSLKSNTHTHTHTHTHTQNSCINFGQAWTKFQEDSYVMLLWSCLSVSLHVSAYLSFHPCSAPVPAAVGFFLSWCLSMLASPIEHSLFCIY